VTIEQGNLALFYFRTWQKQFFSSHLVLKQSSARKITLRATLLAIENYIKLVNNFVFQ
jgi:hypothetical protein